MSGFFHSFCLFVGNLKPINDCFIDINSEVSSSRNEDYSLWEKHFLHVKNKNKPQIKTTFLISENFTF